MSNVFDIIVVGGGMAGVSAAAELARDHKVCVLEQEAATGYHATGRSAAAFVPKYGPPSFQALARASQSFFEGADQEFWPAPLLSPRGEAVLVSKDDSARASDLVPEGFAELPLPELKKLVPLARIDVLESAHIDHDARDIDVDLQLQGYTKLLRANGGEIRLNSKVTGFSRHYGAWQVQAGEEQFSAGLVVNAAGPWAGEVAALAQAQPITITPKRRSAMLLDMPDGVGLENWPLCMGAGETFYFRPMGGRLMLSPADATPVEPHDAWADDMLLAEAVERFQAVMEFEVTRAGQTWGGLRTFAEDGNPVAGFDEAQDNFFWLAGQGGYGIQSAPALARMTAGFINAGQIPADLIACGLDPASVSPARFA